MGFVGVGRSVGQLSQNKTFVYQKQQGNSEEHESSRVLILALESAAGESSHGSDRVDTESSQSELNPFDNERRSPSLSESVLHDDEARMANNSFEASGRQFALANEIKFDRK